MQHRTSYWRRFAAKGFLVAVFTFSTVVAVAEKPVPETGIWALVAQVDSQSHTYATRAMIYRNVFWFLSILAGLSAVVTGFKGALPPSSTDKQKRAADWVVVFGSALSLLASSALLSIKPNHSEDLYRAAQLTLENAAVRVRAHLYENPRPSHDDFDDLSHALQAAKDTLSPLNSAQSGVPPSPPDTAPDAPKNPKLTGH